MDCREKIFFSYINYWGACLCKHPNLEWGRSSGQSPPFKKGHFMMRKRPL
jgi:hypothetical protein